MTKQSEPVRSEEVHFELTSHSHYKKKPDDLITKRWKKIILFFVPFLERTYFIVDILTMPCKCSFFVIFFLNLTSLFSLLHRKWSTSSFQESCWWGCWRCWFSRSSSPGSEDRLPSRHYNPHSFSPFTKFSNVFCELWYSEDRLEANYVTQPG